MARSHLTLAALATAAVAELDVATTTPHRWGAPRDFTAALLTSRSGERYVVRVPRHPQAEAEQSADLVALQAVSAGVRSRLPFGVPTVVGQAPIDGTRAVVYTPVDGEEITLTAMDAAKAAAAGRAIAAVHSLPTSVITDAGLPVGAAIDGHRSTVSLVDRAAATGLVPAALLERWGCAIDDASLWQFQPTVVNGALSASSFRFTGDEVSGVLGWQELRVGDPALDVAWLMASRSTDVVEAALDAYAVVRGGTDRQVRHRGALYAELEIAKWLLHGTDARSTEIVDDAVLMLSNLVDSVRSDLMNPISPRTQPIPTVTEVQAMLDQAERTRTA